MKEGAIKKKAERLLTLLFGMYIVIVAISFACIPIAQATMPVKELKVGFVSPLSGPAGAWGLPCLRTTEILIDKINTAGGIVCKDTRYKIKLIAEDNKYKGSAAVAAVNKLVYEDKVKYIIGDIAGGVIITEQEITNANKVLYFFGGWGDKLLSPEKDFCFRTCLGACELAPAIFKYFHKKYPKATRMAAMGPDDPTGRSNAKESVMAWKSMGLPVVSEEYYARSTTDFGPIVTRVLAAKPEIITMSSAPLGSIALIMKECREKGFTGYFPYNGNFGEAEKLAQIVGDVSYIEGLVSVSVDYTSPRAEPILKQHAKEYIARHGEWGECGILTGRWIEVNLLKQIIEETQSLDTTVLRDHMEKPGFRFDTPWGVKSGWFGGKSRYGIAHQACFPFWLTEIQKGHFVNIEKLTIPKDY